MRKITIAEDAPSTASQANWLDLDAIAKIELTSEDPNFPIESAIATKGGSGWRAALPGRQTLRVVFDNPTPVRRIRLEFCENETSRTQEFVLRWCRQRESFIEIVRQQWNFNPQGSTSEIEDYRVDLKGASIVELIITPDISSARAFASLKAWHLA